MGSDQSRQQLQQALSLWRSGDREGARDIIRRLAKTEPQNADVWFAAGMMADSRGQKIKLLERTLAVNPAHRRARAELDKLTGTFDDPFADIPDKPKRKGHPPEPEDDGDGRTNPVIYALFGAFVLVVVIVVAGVVVLQTRSNALTGQPTAEPNLVVNTAPPAEPTMTPEPSATPAPTNTAPPATFTMGPFGATSTAFLHLEQTNQYFIELTATSAALTNLPYQ